MSQDTVGLLFDNGFYLYGFKAVISPPKNSAPLVWFTYSQYSLNNALTWTEQYAAYTSTTAIVSGVTIVSSADYPMNLGQTLNVTGGSGIGNVTTNGISGAISITNQTTSPLTTGISQQNPMGEFTSMCAFPLFGNNTDVIAPIEQVALMFAKKKVNTGTVIYQAFSQGIFIDLTSDPEREVSYDINQGWSWNGQPWAQIIPSNANLVPFLIQDSPSLEKKKLAALRV
jgi:hypothetical protein